MAFTPFIDDLALIEVMLATVAALLAYAGVLIWWGIRTNDPRGVRGVLRGLSAPLALLGGALFAISLWGEMTWPFLASDGLGGYNIFFFDPLVMIAIVLVSYAIAAQFSLKLQYVGLIALICGAVTIVYGYTGYTATPAFTKDPFDTLLLYLSFGVTGISAFPASVLVDYYLKHAEMGQPILAPGGIGRTYRMPRVTNSRGAQPVVPTAPVTGETPASGGVHFAYWAQAFVLFFPVFAALASIAAFWYFGITLPGHIGSGPANAP